MNAAIYLATQIAGVPGHTAQYGALAFDTVALVLYIQLDAPAGTNWVPILPSTTLNVDVSGSLNDYAGFDACKIAWANGMGGGGFITGMVNGFGGRELTVVNVGADIVLFYDEDGGSAAGNQIKLPTPWGKNILSTDQASTFIYNATTGFWYMVSTTGLLT